MRIRFSSVENARLTAIRFGIERLRERLSMLPNLDEFEFSDRFTLLRFLKEDE